MHILVPNFGMYWDISGNQYSTTTHSLRGVLLSPYHSLCPKILN